MRFSSGSRAASENAKRMQRQRDFTNGSISGRKQRRAEIRMALRPKGWSATENKTTATIYGADGLMDGVLSCLTTATVAAVATPATITPAITACVAIAVPMAPIVPAPAAPDAPAAPAAPAPAAPTPAAAAALLRLEHFFDNSFRLVQWTWLI